MADSLYEYFPKQYMLVGGVKDQYRILYENAIDAAKEHIFRRPMLPGDPDVLIPGTTKKSAANYVKYIPEAQHLACFAGGMVGIAAKIFNRTGDLETARKLVDGCIWSHNVTSSGIMPESFNFVPCSDSEDCSWSQDVWHHAVLDENGEGRTRNVQSVLMDTRLPPGITKINDERYMLR